MGLECLAQSQPCSEHCGFRIKRCGAEVSHSPMQVIQDARQIWNDFLDIHSALSLCECRALKGLTTDAVTSSRSVWAFIASPTYHPSMFSKHQYLRARFLESRAAGNFPFPKYVDFKTAVLQRESVSAKVAAGQRRLNRIGCINVQRSEHPSCLCTNGRTRLG